MPPTAEMSPVSYPEHEDSDAAEAFNRICDRFLDTNNVLHVPILEENDLATLAGQEAVISALEQFVALRLKNNLDSAVVASGVIKHFERAAEQLTAITAASLEVAWRYYETCQSSSHNIVKNQFQALSPRPEGAILRNGWDVEFTLHELALLNRLAKLDVITSEQPYAHLSPHTTQALKTFLLNAEHSLTDDQAIRDEAVSDFITTLALAAPNESDVEHIYQQLALLFEFDISEQQDILATVENTVRERSTVLDGLARILTAENFQQFTALMGTLSLSTLQQKYPVALYETLIHLAEIWSMKKQFTPGHPQNEFGGIDHVKSLLSASPSNVSDELLLRKFIMHIMTPQKQTPGEIEKIVQLKLQLQKTPLSYMEIAS